ncbi:MAG: L,D-transpeptidase [Lachnospiraceae bacterium]|jgi:lipoprotein-anchoring transpeptidase ErfK/SrfK
MNFKKITAITLITVLTVLLLGACGKEVHSDGTDAHGRPPDNEKTSSTAASSYEAAGESAESSAAEHFPEIETGENDKVYTSAGTMYVRRDVEISDEGISPTDDTDYIIRVNLAHETTTVYRLENGGEVPVKAFACSTARGAHETPEGEYYLDEWYDWCYMVDTTYGQYAYRLIRGSDTDYMFHSVPYLEQSRDSLEWADYNKLGSPASMGCVRLNVADARWLCANVGSGVDVIIYSDDSTPGPLGKPDTFFIPWTIPEINGWDPTDPVSHNPWHEYNFTLTTAASLEVSAGSEPLDLREHVEAVDIFENDLSRYITFDCGGKKYGFYYTTKDPEDSPDYPDTTQDELIEYHYNGMDISKSGSYNVRISLSAGPLSAYRNMTVIVK